MLEPMPVHATRCPRRMTRKETIRNLLEVLAQEDRSGLADGYNDKVLPEDIQDAPAAQRLEIEGAEVFNKFEKCIHDLDHGLKNFVNASSGLGGAAGVVSSAFSLRNRLAQILYVFRQNSSHLFPTYIPKQSRESTIEQSIFGSHDIHIEHRRHGRIALQASPIANVKHDTEDIPSLLNGLEKDLDRFLNCLNGFPDFTDDGINASIRSFMKDLTYWSDNLEEYRGKFKDLAVQQYVHELQPKMRVHLDGVTSALSIFVAIGIPIIYFAQEHGAANLHSLSTVSIFLSAVTVTALQISIDTDTVQTPIAKATNGFWFLSLVLSVAATINSFLGLSWKQTMYRSPAHRVPWWVDIWIKHSPFFFLGLSVFCFSVGLCCLAYVTKQHEITTTLTTAITIFTSLGLVVVSLWLIKDRWIFRRHRWREWLSQAKSKIGLSFQHMVSLSTLHIWYPLASKKYDSVDRITKRGQAAAFRAGRHLINTLRRYTFQADTDVEGGIPVAPSNTVGITPSYHASQAAGSKKEDALPALPIILEPEQQEESSYSVFTSGAYNRPHTTGGAIELQAKSPTSSSFSTRAPQGAPSAIASGASKRPSKDNKLGRRDTIVQLDMDRLQPIRQPYSNRDFTPTPASSRTPSTHLDESDTQSKSRIDALQERLTCLAVAHNLHPESLVRHLQFSPDGKYLATTCSNRTTVIWDVKAQFTIYRTLQLSEDISQLAWSPSGDLLLTKGRRYIRVWNLDGICRTRVARRSSQQLAAPLMWFPDGESFVLVEASSAVKVTLNGDDAARFIFERVDLHRVAIVKGNRLLGAGTVKMSKTGVKPTETSNAERRLIVYNMSSGCEECHIPIPEGIQEIMTAKNANAALVSYEDKAPQLWKVELIPDPKAHIAGNTDQLTTTQLTLRCTYLPKTEVDLAGPGHFGGSEDEMVLCADKSGGIHIWDTETGSLLRYIGAQQLGGGLACIGWSRGADPFMFATSCYDDVVQIWTKPPEENHHPQPGNPMAALLMHLDIPHTESPDSEFFTGLPHENFLNPLFEGT